MISYDTSWVPSSIFSLSVEVNVRSSWTGLVACPAASTVDWPPSLETTSTTIRGELVEKASSMGYMVTEI